MRDFCVLSTDGSAGHAKTMSASNAAASVKPRFVALTLALMGGALLMPAAGAAPLKAPAETLQQSVQDLKAFPFKPNCDGNTQEIVACLWLRRNQDDAKLKRLLGSPALLEQWRAMRKQVCGKAAAKAEGGTIQPIVWVGCDNALNAALLKQITEPLGR